MTIVRTPTSITDISARNASLDELHGLLQRQQERRQDQIVSAAELRSVGGHLRAGRRAVLDPTGVTLVDNLFTPNAVCLQQLGNKLGIHGHYLRRMRTDARLAGDMELFDFNVNHWLEREHRSFMLRGFSSTDNGPGIGRALLSDRYSIIENLDVLTAALAGIHAAGVNVDQIQCDLTERHMYVRVECPQVAIQAPALLDGYRSPYTGQTGADNPVVTAGFTIVNSEIGIGAYTIAPYLTVQICDNGLQITKDAKRVVHIGAKQDEGEVAWSAETIQRVLALVTSQTTDAVRAFVSRDYAERTLRDLAALAGKPIADPTKTVEAVGKRLRFSEEERAGIFAHFIRGGTVTAGGVLQAITSYSQTVADADQAHALNRQAVAAMRLAAVN